MNYIHYFNPGHEYAVLNRLPSYTAPASQTTLMRELASLPAWYAKQEDIVLVSDEFNTSYFDFLNSLGISLPRLLKIRGIKQYYEAEICLWGISPQAIRTFEAYNRNYSLNLMIPNWDEKYIYLSSRMAAKDVLADIKLGNSYFDSIALPIICSDIESVNDHLTSLSRDLLVKSPYSSSGRGLLWLPVTGIDQSERQILTGMLKKQVFVSVEPVYDKKIDFAMEFISDGNGNVSFAGYSLFMTNAKGAYEGNYLIPQSDIVGYITNLIDNSILNDTKCILHNILLEYYGSVYKGCIGVDMMIVFEDNKLIIHPCVEINMRYNMGFLAINLFENFIFNTSRGQFFIDFDTKGTLVCEHQKMQKEYPLIVESGRVKSGYLSLCPVDSTTKYRAYILVNNLS